VTFSDEPVDQSTLPWCGVVGEPAERVMHVTEFDAWAALRQATCGHRELTHRCKLCRDTIKALDLFGASDRVRLYPAV
jgi:hypothetical protein